MDPKQTAQLDPKLQEAYNRVMGTAVTPAAPATTNPLQPAVNPVTPTPIPSAPSATPTATTTVSVAPVPAASATASPQQPEQPLPVTPVVMPHSTQTVRVGGGATPVEATPAPSTGVVATSTKKGISPVILILGAVVFFLVYSLFWIKFLNVPVPFINQ